jgi:hypothetical protein
MKTKLVSYEHADNGLSLFIVPETDEERVLREIRRGTGT